MYKEVIESVEGEKERNLKDEMLELKDLVLASNPKLKKIKMKKEKEFKVPFKGRVGKTAAQKGYATVCVIDENNSVRFTKEKIEGGTINLDGITGTFHAVSGKDVLHYKGKPFIIVPKKSKNPYNPNNVKNETYGQKHIMARMLNETIKFGKKVSGLAISIGALIIGGVIVYALITG